MPTTLGIDLASQPANTALCVVAWHSDGAEVRVLARSTWGGTPLHDELLSAAARGSWGNDHGRPEKVAIDAPFGWPDPFVRAVHAHHELRPWPAAIDATRAPFERRETDRFVRHRAGKLPLSVSTDRIAYPAMRCAVILGDLARHVPPALLARDGSGLVAEAYPDAALRMWLPDLWDVAQPDSYKGGAERAKARRPRILGALRAGLGPGFRMTAEQAAACEASDDALDALVCALVARAVQRGLTIAPETDEQRALALREGWIHLPQPGSLAGLV